MPARNPVLADHVEERKTTIVMTKEERLAALKRQVSSLRMGDILASLKKPHPLENGADMLREEVKSLNKIISEREIEFRKMEASRDEYKTLYQEALAAAERQREDLESKSMSYDAWQRRCLLFAVREGDAARVLGTDNKWVHGSP